MEISKYDAIKFLFKYRNFENEYHLRTLTLGEFYYAKLDELNDPFELKIRPVFESIDPDIHIENLTKRYGKEIESIKSKNPNEPSIIDKLKTDPKAAINEIINIWNDYLKNTRVCSFTANKCNSILMWSHYSNNHSGFCIGLNYQKLRSYWDFIAKQNILKIPYVININYSDSFPYINPILGNLTDNFDDFEKVLNTKFNIWKYENEVRFYKFEKYDDGNNILHFSKEFIDCVYLGIRCNEENRNKVISILKSDDLRHVKLFQLKQATNSFKIIRDRIIID